MSKNFAKVSTLLTADGTTTLVSENFGETYHSRHGALAESNHVFIEHGLSRYSGPSNPIDVLEIGLGTCLNAVLSWHHCEKEKKHLTYTGVEAYPVSIADSQKLNFMFSEDLKFKFKQIIETPWSQEVELDECFTLTKVESLFEDYTTNNEMFDVIFHDAFAPQIQPQFWESPFLVNLYNWLKPNGFLVTYCARGSFKRDLKEIGFDVIVLPGAPGKREMTKAVKL